MTVKGFIEFGICNRKKSPKSYIFMFLRCFVISRLHVPFWRGVPPMTVWGKLLTRSMEIDPCTSGESVFKWNKQTAQESHWASPSVINTTIQFIKNRVFLMPLEIPSCAKNWSPTHHFIWYISKEIMFF